MFKNPGGRTEQQYKEDLQAETENLKERRRQILLQLPGTLHAEFEVIEKRLAEIGEGQETLRMIEKVKDK